MKNFIKLISMLLTVFMLLSSFAVMFTVQTLAADADTNETETKTTEEDRNRKEKGLRYRSVRHSRRKVGNYETCR